MKYKWWRSIYTFVDEKSTSGIYAFCLAGRQEYNGTREARVIIAVPELKPDEFEPIPELRLYDYAIVGRFKNPEERDMANKLGIPSYGAAALDPKYTYLGTADHDRLRGISQHPSDPFAFFTRYSSPKFLLDQGGSVIGVPAAI